MIRQIIVGTRVGRIAQSTKALIGLCLAARRHGESMGTHCNDVIAEKLITNMCPNGGCFVDIGAHIGSISSEVLRTAPNATIYAVEAMPDKAENLQKKFKKIHVLNYAVGNDQGIIPFYVNKSRSGYSSIIQPSSESKDIWKEIQVKTKRLDQIILDTAIDVIKIDVEGAEYDVIRGSKNIIRNFRPLIMFESGPYLSSLEKNIRIGIFNFFKDNNYIVLIPNRLAHNDDGLTIDCFLDSHIYPRRTTNYFAIPVEKKHMWKEKARAVLRFK